MQNGLSTQKTIASTQHLPTQKADMGRSDVISGLVMILLPIVMICTIVGHRKYRATVLQKRIQYLDRIWQLSSSKNLS